MSRKQYVLNTTIAMLVAGALATPASADVIGQLSISNSSNGAVSVSATTIDWIPDVNNVATGADTNLTYTGGAIDGSNGVLGTLKDLTFGEPFPVEDFMTFAGHPNLHFDLTQVGPGSANTNCAGAVNNGDSCSPLVDPPGDTPAFVSPFLLTKNATGTSVTLSVFGVARDLSPNLSDWAGSFTTQITQLVTASGVINAPTPAQIAAVIAAGGTITSTHSAEFAVTSVNVVPEPASLLLLGSGLAGVAVRARKRRQS